MLQPTSADASLTERVVIRFGATLAANLLRAALSFASGILVARGLGAPAYGDLNFLMGSFTAISLFLDMGTSCAFYTFISQRRRSQTFVALYLAWIVLQFIATVLAVGLLLPANLVKRIWVGHERDIVLLAFGASFLMTQGWGVVSQLGEAVRKTVFVQVAAVAQAVVHLGLVAAAMQWKWLSVPSVIWLLIGEYALLVAGFGPRLVRVNIVEKSQARDDARTVAKEFVIYCAPLAVYGCVGFLCEFADRWLLQQFGGPAQQGFFAIGQQFANISLIATTSILKVFWKEVAEARERQDHQRTRRLYFTVSHGLFFAGAWISCLLIPYSREILGWTVGPEYEVGWPALGLLFLYPIYQSLGQIGGTFFYASGFTGHYARIGLMVMGVSIPITYLLLASPSAMLPGLGLGAVGLALKTVMLAIISVNLQLYQIARIADLGYDYGYQGIVIVLLGLGLACKWASGWMLGLAGPFDGSIGVVVLSVLLYAGLSLAMVYRAPELAGVTREQMMKAAGSTVRRLRENAV